MVCYLKYFITCDLHTLFHSIFLPFLSTPSFIVISLFDQSYSLPVIFSFLVLLTFCSPPHLIELCSYPIFLYVTVYLLISTAVPLTLASLAAARRYRGSRGLRNVAVRCYIKSSNWIRLKFHSMLNESSQIILWEIGINWIKTHSITCILLYFWVEEEVSHRFIMIVISKYRI